MSAAYRLGLECKMYVNTGTYGSPVWLELANTRDVKLGRTKGKADATTRATGGWKAFLPTLKEAGLTFKMLYDPADTGYTAIETLFFASTAAASTKEFALMDGDITVTATKGFRASFGVDKFDRDESLEEAVTVDVEMSIAPSANAPAAYVVS